MYGTILNNNLDQYPLTISEIRRMFPDVSFGNNPNPTDLLSFNIVKINPTPHPEYNSNTHKIISDSPILENGVWIEQWKIQPLTAEEIDNQLTEFRAGLVCTPRQASLALLQTGLLDIVETWIATQSRQVQIDWNRATEIRRDWPLINQAAIALNLSETQLDDLFLLAQTL